MTVLDKRAEELIRRLTEDDDTAHVAYDTLAAFVDGTGKRDDRRSILEHISHCAACAADVRDLRETAECIQPRRPAVWLAAAAALILVTITALLVFRNAPPQSSAGFGIHDAAERAALDPRDAAAVHAALARGTIEIAPAALALREREGKLMGAPGAKFDVLAPVATYVPDTRPRFTWTALAGTRRYRLEVYDGARLVLSSPEIAGTAWTADRDLARGHEYVWQVVAEDRISAPAPPAPPARFGVLSADAVVRINATARRYHGSHLLLAIAAAREGAVEEARAELLQVQKRNPDSASVSRLVRKMSGQ